MDDEIYNSIEPGKSCDKLVRDLLSKQQSGNTKELSKYIFERLYPTLFKFSLSTTSDREKMYQKIYDLAVNNVFFKEWEEYLMFYGINDRHSNMLWQYIIDRYLLYLVKERKTIQCLPVNEISSEDLRLTAVEENTPRYVSGYIPYSLRQKYLKLKEGVTSRVILSGIEFWSVDPALSSKIFFQYTEEWTNKTNRGGLINVTDEFYIFISHVEMPARNILNTNLMKKHGGENIETLFMSELTI